MTWVKFIFQLEDFSFNEQNKEPMILPQKQISYVSKRDQTKGVLEMIHEKENLGKHKFR